VGIGGSRGGSGRKRSRRRRWLGLPRPIGRRRARRRTKQPKGAREGGDSTVADKISSVERRFGRQNMCLNATTGPKAESF
jgi:hypothetical protein